MKDPRVFLEHVLDSIEHVESYVAKSSKEDFLASPKDQDAVLRRLEVIGEAVKNLPKTLRDAHPEIPWREMAGMRDVLIHEYFNVDLQLAWRAVQRDLPRVKDALQKILASLPRKPE